MERNKALIYLNEIRDACESFGEEDRQVIEIKTNVQYAVGYAILIRSFLNSVCKGYVANIAQKYQLSIQEGSEGIVIFQPKS